MPTLPCFKEQHHTLAAITVRVHFESASQRIPSWCLPSLADHTAAAAAAVAVVTAAAACCCYCCFSVTKAVTMPAAASHYHSYACPQSARAHTAYVQIAK
eukprot:9063-Heterococcus_DN1.PRE.2